MAKIGMLERYRVDRADGMTAAGPEKLVILMLKANDGPEISFACSKVDAMMISIQLSNAANELKQEGH